MGLLRFYLAISVVIAHNGLEPLGISGLLAVYVFFMISGFVICFVLNEKYGDNHRDFWIARFLRLWPSYAVVTLGSMLFLGPIVFHGYPLYASLYGYFVVVTMFFYQTLHWIGLDPQSGEVLLILGRGSGDRMAAATHMGHMWSIGMEIVFYAFAPFLARRPRRLLVALAITFALHLAITVYFPSVLVLRRLSVLNFAWLFVLGMLAYWAWALSRDLLDRVRIPSKLAALAGCLLVFWGIAVVQLTLRTNPILADGMFVIFAIAIVPLFHLTRNDRLDRWLGEFSYPIYLIHYPIVIYGINQHRGDWLWTLLIVLICFAGAALLNGLVDRPVERIRRRFNTPRINSER